MSCHPLNISKDTDAYRGHLFHTPSGDAAFSALFCLDRCFFHKTKPVLADAFHRFFSIVSLRLHKKHVVEEHLVNLCQTQFQSNASGLSIRTSTSAFLLILQLE